MDKKPSVFPTQEERAAIIEKTDAQKIADYEAEKSVVTGHIYDSTAKADDTPQNHATDAEMMRARTDDQMKRRSETGVVQEPDLSVAAVAHAKRLEAEAKERNETAQSDLEKRDAQLKYNEEQTAKYHESYKEATNRHLVKEEVPVQQEQYVPPVQAQQPAYVPPVQAQQPPYIPPTPPAGPNRGELPSNTNPYVAELSQIDFDAPFDVIPLPSEGKLYANKKPNIKVAYMTTADEDILTSPNLLESGEFLEILINRKILDPSIRYKDLNVGDRNAIMLWLRATAYGEMYPVTLLDENDVVFDTEVNLNDLKTINLSAEPDTEGLFDFTLPSTGVYIKFRLLTCGDVDDIEKLVIKDKEDGNPVNKTSTYTLERLIVEVNGDRNKSVIKHFLNSIRINDGKKFSEYVESIQSGIDLNITVGTPGGGSVTTFLPLNINFFWPDIKL